VSSRSIVSLTDEVIMKPVVSTPTRRTNGLRCALAVILLLAAFGASAVAAQPPATASRTRDLEAEMNALKTQMQRFELQAPGASSRHPDFDAMLNALKARLDRLESPLSAGGAAIADRQLVELRRQLDDEKARLRRMESRNTASGIAFALLCACVCALWAMGNGRGWVRWFLGGLVFNFGALVVALYHAREDTLIREARALGSSDSGAGR
jgi:hypothetical protein